MTDLISREEMGKLEISPTEYQLSDEMVSKFNAEFNRSDGMRINLTAKERDRFTDVARDISDRKLSFVSFWWLWGVYRREIYDVLR